MPETLTAELITEINTTMAAVQETVKVRFTPNPIRVHQEMEASEALEIVFRKQLDYLNMAGIMEELQDRFGPQEIQEGRIQEGATDLSDTDLVFIEKLVKRTWNPDDKTFTETVEDFLTDSVNAAGADALGKAGIKGAFDLTHQGAIEQIKRHGAELVKGVNDTTRDAIKSRIVRGLKSNKGTYGKIGRDIQGIFQMSRRRADTIANTEVGNAMRQANHYAYKNNGMEHKSWIAEPDACPLCISNEEQGIIEIDKLFVNGMTPHPNCRCDVLPEPLGPDGDLAPTPTEESEAWTGGDDGDFVLKSYQPQPNKKVAEAWAKEAFELKKASFGTMDIKVINAWLEGIHKMVERFPAIKDELNFLGTHNAWKSWAKSLGQSSRGGTSSVATAIQKRIPHRGKIFSYGDASGVSINPSYAKGQYLDVQDTFFKRSIEASFQPVGTEAYASGVTHEAAHHLGFMMKTAHFEVTEKAAGTVITKSMQARYDGWAKIMKLWADRSRLEIKEQLASYGAKSMDEFVATAMAEYYHNPAPRALAKEIGEIIKEVFREGN